MFTCMIASINNIIFQTIMNIVWWVSVRCKNEMGTFFSDSWKFSFRKPDFILPKRHCLFKTKIHTLPSHCPRDSCTCSKSYIVFCEKVESKFVSDADYLKTACMNERWLFDRHWNRLLFCYILYTREEISCYQHFRLFFPTH